MRAEYTPGQYVNVRATELEPWQVRIFMGWNEPRVIQGHYQHARVMLRDAYQYSPDAASESFLLIEPWVPQVGQWVWLLNAFSGAWCSHQCQKASQNPFYSGGVTAPLTLPPFVKPGDKY